MTLTLFYVSFIDYCFSEFNMKEELIEWSQAVSFVSGMSCFSSHSTDLSTQSYSSFDSLPSLLSQSTAKSEAEKDEKDVRKYSLLVSEGLISVMSTATELGYREKLLETMQLDSNLNSTQFQNSVEAKLRSYITSTR